MHPQSLSRSRTFSSFQKETPYLLAVTPHLPSPSLWLAQCVLFSLKDLTCSGSSWVFARGSFFSSLTHCPSGLSYVVLSTRGCAGICLARSVDGEVRPHVSGCEFLTQRGPSQPLFTLSGVHPTERLLGEKEQSRCVFSLPVDDRETRPQVCTPQRL